MSFLFMPCNDWFVRVAIFNQVVTNENAGCKVKMKTFHELLRIAKQVCIILWSKSKLWHYGIRGIANDRFKSNLTNRMQYISIDGNSSDLRKVNFLVPQGSVLGHLLFLQYINYLQSSIRFSSPFHFADDTVPLNIQNTIFAINKTRNKDLSELIFWLNAN